MTIVDANLLLYAYDSNSPQHEKSATWLSALIDSRETVALPWITLWAFIRICTNPKLWEHPRSTTEILGIVSDWLSQPAIVILQPGPRHWQILSSLVVKHQVRGPLLTDATLAALALENGATLASSDQGFSRYSGLQWVNPLQ